MLITNFSAGELSEDLFGRIDLQQYFQGAAHIENFDLIPSGGIEKRRGTKRILSDLQNGRIIPFIISREEAYILYFTNEKITVYRVGKWDAPVEVFVNDNISTEAKPEFLYTDAEIPFVQHAQNFNRIIFVHENHPPFEITRNSEDDLGISVFNINLNVDVNVSEAIKEPTTFEMDKTYIDNGYLISPFNYPRAVTFMNSRLIFAGTFSSPQKLFISRVSDINNFSTYKRYLTEQREYLIIEGSISENSNQIEVIGSGEQLFTLQADISKFFIDAFFPKDAVILSITGTIITMSRQSTIETSLTEGPGSELELLNNWKTSADNAEDNPAVYIDIAKAVYRTKNEHGGLIVFRQSFYSLYISVTKVKVIVRNNANEKGGIDATREFILNISHRDTNFSMSKAIESWLKEIRILNNAFFYAWQNNFNSINFDNAINKIKQNLTDFWYYNLITRKREYWGSPNNIYADILRETSADKTVFIPFYTRKVLEERYPTADDGFTFELASDRNDKIRWLVQNKHLIAGTESAEYIIPSNITAISISAFLNSFYGSSYLQATSAGDAVLFFRDGNKGLVEYYIPEADNYFRTNDLLLFARQMLQESEVVDYDIVTSPNTKIIITREDGKLVILFYDRSFGVFAWSRYSGTGKVRSLAVVPGENGYDDIYLLVEYGNTNKRYYLELLDYESKVFLDNYTEVTQENFESVRDNYKNIKPTPVLCCLYNNTKSENIYESLDIKKNPFKDPFWNPGAKYYIGYPYNSSIRTLPILSNAEMAKQRIASVSFRFLKSYLPQVSSIANGQKIKTDTITNPKEPFTGVHKISFPSSWNEDVQIELTNDEPEPVKILAINAEVQ
ncbi:MAG: hypothetical protein FWD78_02915 [Treponema sp.]|nr:hypothetical protein [Treponema sp.]